MKVISSLKNKSPAISTERCETVLKFKDRVIELNLNLISDDSISFSENSFDEQTSISNSVESPVKLNITKCFMMRKPFKDEDSFEEPRTSTPLFKKEESGDRSDSDRTKPQKVVQKKRKPSSKRSFACDLCPKFFVNKIFFIRHLEQHKEGFNCNYCGKSFANKAKVRRHENYVHVASRLHNCDQCPKGFRSRTSLRAHRALHSPTAEKFYCKSCGKNYVLKKSYKKHLKYYPSHDISKDLKSL